MEGLSCKLTRSMCFGGIQRILEKSEERVEPDKLLLVHDKIFEFNRRPLLWTNRIMERLDSRRILTKEDKDMISKLLLAINTFDEDANAPLVDNYLFGYHLFNKLMVSVDELLGV